MSADPFAPARRALVVGPLMLLVGGGITYLGIAGSGLAWLLCVLGGLIMMFGFLRLVGGFVVLGLERRRKELLREGEASTVMVNSAKQIGTQSGYPILKLALEIRDP